MSEGLDNFKNRSALIKCKFTQSHTGDGQGASIMQQSFANNFTADASIKELKKLDLFDLGITLTLASIGGLEMINEEFLAKIPNIQTSCCLIHAIKSFHAQ